MNTIIQKNPGFEIAQPLETANQRSGLAALTGLRFIAASLVFFHHITYVSVGVPDVLNSFMHSGYNGVTIFFVLSGFVICYNYYDKMATNMRPTLGPYFLARFARVYPLYFLVVIGSFLYLIAKSSQNISLTTLSQHLLMLQAWNPDNNIAYALNSPGWSISVEAFLYLSFPVIAWGILRHCNKISQMVLVGLGVVSLDVIPSFIFALYGQTDFLGSAHYWLYRFPLIRLDDFILGAVTARIFMQVRNQPVKPQERRTAFIAMTVALTVAIMFMVFDIPLLGTYRFDAAYTLPSAIIIFALARYQFLPGRLLSLPIMVLLGEASYAFYLIHSEFIHLASGFLQNGNNPLTYLGIAATYGLTIVVAILIFTFFEKPVRNRIRAIAKPAKKVPEFQKAEPTGEN